MTRIFKFLSFILSVLVILCSSSISTTYVYASTNVEYTDVFDDLRKDETFNINDYPSIADDYSLQVINIAEGYNKELYLYVYQPSNDTIDLKGLQISMSNEYSNNGSNLKPILYDLELVSTYDVFDKYIVKDYQISDEAYRYYNIISIYREVNETIDTNIVGGTTTAKAYDVGQQWCCYYLNDELIYEMNTFETIEITPTLNGNVFFDNGYSWGSLIGIFEKCNAHFIAFNVEDYIVEKIFDADLTYQIRSHTEDWYTGQEHNHEYGSYETKYLTLTSQDTVSYKGNGIGGVSANWNRIMRASDFVEQFESQGGTLTKGSRETLLNSQWVFSFLETEYTKTSAYLKLTYHYTITESEVADVTILRLHFMDNNQKIYDLGVVADKTTADKIADGNMTNYDFFEEWFEKLGMIIGIIALLVILGFCGPILGIVLNIILSVLKLVFKGVITIISLPFKLIAKLLKPKNKKP